MSGPRRLIGDTLRHSAPATAAALVMAGIVTAAAAAPLIAPYDPQYQDLSHSLALPSADHLLGTDRLGRDVLSRLLFGARVTLIDVAIAAGVFLLLGIPLGVIAGYLGGWPDRLVGRAADLVLAVPGIVVLLMVVAVFPGNDIATMIAFGVIACPNLLRVVRGSTLAVRNELYVVAARLTGLSTWFVLRRHVLPRIAGPIIVQTSLFCSAALLAESGLSFLGLTRPESKGPSWGNMVAEASNAMGQSSWLLIPTGGALVITVMAFGLIGDAVRDATMNRTSAGPMPPRRAAAASTTAGRATGKAAENGGGAAGTRPARFLVGMRPATGVNGTGSRTPGAGGAGTSGAGTGGAAAVTGDAAATGDVDAADEGGMPVLSVRGLHVAVPGSPDPVTVLRDVSFDIGPGETVGIVGESGCGKSMTAKAIIGLLPPGAAVTAGQVMFGGRDLTTLPERELARKVRGSGIALIPQDPIGSLDPTFTVGSQLREVIRRHKRLSRTAAQQEAERLLRLVRLPDPRGLLRRRPDELSGGMAQRVCLAMALAAEPTLLIADEPTTALDVTVQAEILALLRDLQADLGMAILLITHDWGVLADMCHRAVVMYAGEVVETGPVEELFGRPRHPYTAALHAANPQAAPTGRPLPTIPGVVPRPGQRDAGCRFRPRCPYAGAGCDDDVIPLISTGPRHGARCVHTELLERR